MATKKPIGQRKKRTREHVIADLAVNHIERFVLLSGHSTERVQHDYGIDLLMFAYSRDGELENGQVLIQVKATDDLKRAPNGRFVAWRVDRRDLRHWLRESDPVVLVVYSAQENKAYWLYVQAHYAAKRPLDLFTAEGTLTLHIPTRNRVGLRTAQMFNLFRENVVRQVEGRIQHHA